MSFEPTSYWRVLTPSGELWLETKSETEARANATDGYTLERLYEKVERKWKKEVI
jgi:hypothetical protein